MIMNRFTLRARALITAALAVAALFLAGCSSLALDTAKTPPTQQALDDRWLEIKSMNESYYGGSFSGDSFHADAKSAELPAANCPYRSTPEPKATRLWFLDIVIPLTIEYRIFVNCDDGKQRKIRSGQQKAGGLALANRWYALARQPTVAEELNAFGTVAAEFRVAPTNPGASETMRPYKIAAEAAVREKRWTDAILAYRKALAIEPTWPQARYNLALIYAEMSINEAAILEMQKYLLLVPDAANARQAQDKIYEWKAKP